MIPLELKDDLDIKVKSDIELLKLNCYEMVLNGDFLDFLGFIKSIFSEKKDNCSNRLQYKQDR